MRCPICRSSDVIYKSGCCRYAGETWKCLRCGYTFPENCWDDFGGGFSFQIYNIRKIDY